MFERGKAIREAKKAEMLARALERERQRIKDEMEQKGIAVTPEMETILYGDAVSNV